LNNYNNKKNLKMQPGENLEEMKLQELSKRLEAIEKDNEQIKREN
jgi:hypothetical protein